MKICPNCRKIKELVKREHCELCGWTLSKLKDIELFLSDDDVSSVDFDVYLKNYDQLSVNNLHSPESYGAYLKIQNDKLFSYCGKLRNKKVCEIGFGRGYLFKKIVDESPEKLVGIDISPTYIERLRTELNHVKNIELIMANAENIPYYDEFDCIIASDVLEHVLNPGNFIFSINQALRKNGRFIVRVPCNENILVYSKYMGCKFKYAHLRNFNKASLKAIINYAGFVVEKIHYDGYLANRKRNFIKYVPFLNQYIERFVAKKKDLNEVAAINNFIGRVFMRPIEIALVCRKTDNLISRVEQPVIKGVSTNNKLSTFTWDYEHYQPNTDFQFILNITESSGKVLLSKLIGDTLSCEIDLSFITTEQPIKANVYATYKGETIANPSKDYYFDIH